MNKEEMILAAELITFHEEVGYYIPLESSFFELTPDDQSLLIASARAGIRHQELAGFVEKLMSENRYNHDYLFEDAALDYKTRVVLATFRGNPFMSFEMREFCIDLYYETQKYDAKRAPSAGLRRAVIAVLGTKCFYCKNETPEKDLHMDHFVPYSRGGKTNLGNLVPACPTCNEQKSDKPYVKFLQWRARR